MAISEPPRRKHPKAPPGCDGHLTRRQAARLLGFPSEFKIRQLEREGRLRSVRGPMRTAFYAREDVLAVKADLSKADAGRSADDEWSDAELIVLLQHPNSHGHPRTPLDLVLETRISIERAQKVHTFWSSCRSVPVPAPSPPPVPQPGRVLAQNQEGGRPSSEPPDERRSADRVARDTLIAELRHPDPRIREQAFARLKERPDG
jgi:hypothetical protein